MYTTYVYNVLSGSFSPSDFQGLWSALENDRGSKATPNTLSRLNFITCSRSQFVGMLLGCFRSENDKKI